MKKQTFTLVLLSLCMGTAVAQNKIKDGTVTGSTSLPNASAVLELESNNRGLLMPRVALTGTTAAAPLAAHVAGMTVYNTATTGDVTPGTYYNDGTKWVKLAGVGTPSWLTTGNTGTTPPTAVGTAAGAANYWGTTDAKNLAIGTNGFTRAIMNQSGSLFGGTGTYDVNVNPGFSLVWGGNHKDSSSYTLVSGNNNALSVGASYSAVFGINNTVRGTAISSIVGGSNNTSDARNSLVAGNGNTITDLGNSSGTLVVGTNNTCIIDGYPTAMLGAENFSNGQVFMTGYGNIDSSQGVFNTVFGYANTISNPANVFHSGGSNLVAGTSNVTRYGEGNLIVGKSNQCLGASAGFSTKGNIMGGTQNTLNNTTSSFVIGVNNTLSGNSSSVIAGTGLTATLSNTAYAANMYVPGSIQYGTLTAISDRRFKSNFTPLGYGLNTVMQLQPQEYDQVNAYRVAHGAPVTTDKGYEGKHHSFGFIAQDLYKVIPEAVKKPLDEQNDNWGVDYVRLVPVLVKAIQEQEAKIEALEQKLAKLQGK